MIPDDVVGLLQAGALRRGDELVQRSHEVGHRRFRAHAADAVVPPGDDTEQAAVRRAVISDGDRGMSGLLLQRQNVRQRRVRPDIRVAGDEARLVALDRCNHRRLGRDGLRAVDERDTALARQRDGQLLAGNGLHDGRDHRNIHRDGRFLTAAVAHERRAQGDSGRDAFARRKAGHQQILIERMRRFGEEIGHIRVLL